MDYLKPFGCDVIKQVDTYDLIELCRHIILFCSILFSFKNECDTIIFDRLVEKKMGKFFFHLPVPYWFQFPLITIAFHLCWRLTEWKTHKPALTGQVARASLKGSSLEMTIITPIKKDSRAWDHRARQENVDWRLMLPRAHGPLNTTKVNVLVYIFN